MAISNTVLYEEEWVTKMQERLAHPTNWKEICNVDYTDNRVLHNPYMSTTPTAASHARGTAMTIQTFVLTDESRTINQSRIVPMYKDWADWAQCGFDDQMNMAALQADLLNEYLETDMLANHAMWTNLTNADIGGAAGNITVAANNIDDIIRAIKTKTRTANGHNLASRFGYFACWRPADFELLEGFVQANGFSSADSALKEGVVPGLRYMGVDHYVSNDHTSGHLMGGVKKQFHLGVLKATFGKLYRIEHPADTTPLSGMALASRVDWEYISWNNTDTVLFDITVT